MNFIVREGDKICTPDLIHYYVVESIDPATVVVQFNGERRRVPRSSLYEALSEGSLMVLERA